MPLIIIIPLFTGIRLLFDIAGKAQLIDIYKPMANLAVFSGTEVFDSTYLALLKKGDTYALPGTIRLAIGNCPAYYHQCRKGCHLNHSLKQETAQWIH